MILLLVTLGSRGDIEPFVALGRALVDIGHEVRLATQREFAEATAGSGIDFHGIDFGSTRDLLDLPAAQAAMRSMRNVRAIRRLMDALTSRFEAVYRVTLAAAGGADAVLCHPMTFPALDVANRLGLPVIQVHHVPAIPTRRFPSPTGSRIGRTLGPVGNRASYALDQWLAWRLTSRVMNRLGGQGLRPPPLSAAQATAIRNRRLGVVVGVSPHVLPPPDDWPSDVVMTGYLRTAEVPSASLDQDTERFLRAGNRPVFVTLGSTPVPDAAAVTRQVAAATRAVGLRAILQRGTARLGDAETEPDHIHVVEDIAYPAVFDRVAAVVHHGGAGTTAQALRQGRPTLTLPSFADQYFWAHRVPAIGAGPAPLPLPRLTTARLASRLDELTSTGSFAARARAVGVRIHGEDGPRRAAVVVDDFLRPHRSRPR